MTALHHAAKKGHLHVVKLLVEAGAAPDAVTNDGKPPIFFAVAKDHCNVYSYLIQKKHDSYTLLKDKTVSKNVSCSKLPVKY